MTTKNLVRKINHNLNQVTDAGFVRIIEKSEEIPKIIHQTYFTNQFSPEIKANIKKLKDENPDWEYRFYDDSDIQTFIKSNFPEIIEIYNKINPKYGAARADLFRYLVMYKDGGVYLDIKSSLSKPLNEIIKPNDQYILAYWLYSENPGSRHTFIPDSNGEFQQWHIICSRGHPFLEAVIQTVCRNIQTYNVWSHEVGMMGVLKLTGPIAYSNSILPILHLHKHKIGFDVDFGLTYSIFNNDHNNHQRLFKTHYKKLDEPILVQSMLIKFIYPVFVKLKKWKE